MNEKIKALFEDLGKPTLRGIRKCPKCGTFNGTRGMTCKNKACNAVFKEAKELPKTQAVKIISSSESQIYSVRVQDRNPDTWSFVQLPSIQGLNLLHRTPEVELIFQSAAQCYVESCQKSNEDISQLSLNICQHVTAALSAVRETKPLQPLKNTVLNLLPISTEIKTELWKLSSETDGPLVQRVSKNCMVVKCKPDESYPLGFLHVRVFSRYNRDSSFKYRMICDCESLELLKARVLKDENRCVHYYACMCAFAGDKKLSKEFKGFSMIANVEKAAVRNICTSSPKRKISILESGTSDSEIVPKVILIEGVNPTTKRKENSLAGTNSDLLLLQHCETETWSINDSFSKSLHDSPSKKNAKSSSLPIDETSVKLSFLSWLASVTERINQTMHFQFDGKPDPLVFHAPQMFFDCLQQRISCELKKKRLPHTTCTFERKDALPLGKFSKYTWKICDLYHVKQIFDTPEMALQVTRSFVENRDGTYEPYSPVSDGEQLAEHYKKTSNNALIKPSELKTFLKVGHVTPNFEEEVPFIIEWIPNLLPKSNIGELHIKFEFGHMRNGKVVVGGPSLYVEELPT